MCKFWHGLLELGACQQTPLTKRLTAHNINGDGLCNLWLKYGSYRKNNLLPDISDADS